MSGEDGRFPLDWVDGFIAKIRPYLFYREEDGLLILLPNQSYRLNGSGKKLIKPLLDGRTLFEALGNRVPPAHVQKDLFHFFTGIVALVKGCLGEGKDRPEVETVEYKPPFHDLPVLSEIAVTYKCNLECRFCYAENRCEEGSRDMSLEEIGRVIRRIRHEAKVPSVSLTGGEPTCRKDLPEIIRLAKSEGMRVNLITNGTLMTEPLARRLRDAGLDSAQVSLEGPDQQTHEGLTEKPGSFQATLAGLKALQKAEITVHTNTTLSRGNLAQAPLMPAFLKNQGMDRFSMNMIIPSAQLMKFRPDLLVRYEEIGPIVLGVRESARNEGIRFMWYSPTPYCLFNPIAYNLGNKGCAACDGLLSVDAQGRVLPCSSFFEPQGSLLEQPFQEIWQSAQSRNIRDKQFAPAHCRKCELMHLCEGACPLYWQIMTTRELHESHGSR